MPLVEVIPPKRKLAKYKIHEHLGYRVRSHDVLYRIKRGNERDIYLYRPSLNLSSISKATRPFWDFENLLVHTIFQLHIVV